MPKIIISPVGTSILTNFNKNTSKKIGLAEFANANAVELDARVLNEFESFAKEIELSATNWDEKAAKAASAELNGLLSLEPPDKNNLYYFVVTDTLQARASFEIVQFFLRHRYKIEAHAVIIRDMTTADAFSFNKGIKNLLKQLEEIDLNSYRSKGYEVVFNLTGGFKSLLGYLHTIGMFYADKLVYIFEAGTLIEIPRLPVVFDNTVFEQYSHAFLLMSLDFMFPQHEIANIPATLVDEIGDGFYSLSPWGSLCWNQVSTGILSEKLVNLPLIRYTSQFISDFKDNNSREEKKLLQLKLGMVSILLMEKGMNTSALATHNGIRYENCHRKRKGHTIGHFRYTEKKRVSCYIINNELVMERNGFHDVCP